MLRASPILLKEFIQAAHRRRTFVLRAALPALLVVMMFPSVADYIEYGIQDWRSLADFTRPLFQTCAWFQLAALALLSFVAPGFPTPGSDHYSNTRCCYHDRNKWPGDHMALL